MTRRIVLIVISFLATLSACSGSSDSEKNRNADAVSLQHTEIWSKGNMELISTVYAEDYVGHFPGGTTVNGRDGIQAEVTNHRAAFPDWVEEIQEIIIEGNLVATHFRSTGTHLGPFQGIPASGNGVEITEASIYRMANGQIAEQWAYPDVLSLMQQITTDTNN